MINKTNKYTLLTLVRTLCSGGGFVDISGGWDRMVHTNKRALARAVLLGLGLATVFGGMGLAADPLILDGNTKTVGTATGETTIMPGSSVVGVLASPTFSEPGSQVQMNDNALTVVNSQTGAVTGLYDLTDNTQNRPQGETSSLTAENNKLTITGSTVGETMQVDLFAPNASSQNTIANNQGTLTDTTVNGGYYGIFQQYGSGNMTRTANEADFKDSTVNGWIMGSFFNREVNDLTSRNNVISLTGSTVGSYVMQDYTYGNKGEFTGNQTILDNSKVLGMVVGENFTGLTSNATLTAQNNDITLQNKSFTGSAITVSPSGTQTSSEASANTLTITGSSALLFGTPVEGSATASGNAVTLEDGSAGILAGAIVDGDTNGNTVTLSGDSTVDYDKTLATLQAQGITSAESGVPFNSFKGYSLVIGAMSMNGSASNNAINVTGNVDLTNAELYGALNSTLTKPAGTGNTLRVGYDGSKAAAWNRNQVKAIGAFDKVELWQGSWGTPLLKIAEDSNLTGATVDVSHLTFTDAAPAKPDSETVLVDDDVTEYESGKNVTLDDGNHGNGLTFGYTLGSDAATLTGSFTGKAGTKAGNIVLSTGNVDVGSVKFGQVTWGTTPLTLDSAVTYDFKDSKIDTGSISFTGLDSLSAGKNTMTLLDTNGRAVNLTAGNLSGETLPYTVGTTLEGQGQAYLEGGNVQYAIDLHDNTVKPQPQTHMTVIGQDAGLAAVLEGSDLVLRDLLTLKDKENGPFTFASALGGENRYETGSSLRTNGWNGHAGFGWKKDFGGKGVGETALFYDYGDGNYRTYDAGLYGHGDLRYRGVGLLGRFTNPDKVFVEGSVRTGRVDNKARNVLRDGAGNGYDYDTDSRYTAFHLGAGRTVDLNSRDSLEWYGRYFYTHVNGDDFEAGGQYHLDSVDSSLLRLGARWQRKSGKDAWYAGAAYEYEFDGEATGTADGRPIRSASLQGSSARLEAGMLWNRDNWTIQTGVHGYLGKHRGVGGSVDLMVHL